MNIIIYKLFMHNNYENVKPSFEKNHKYVFLKDLSSYTSYYYYYYQPFIAH